MDNILKSRDLRLLTKVCRVNAMVWPLDVKSQLIGKDRDAGKDLGQEEKRVAENEMVR